MSQFAVIMPAAGRSSRFGGAEKKPFASLNGRPVWVRAAELFWSRPDVSRVYLVISPDDRDEFRSRFAHLLMFANAEVVLGGAERFESVANALAVIPADIPFVAVHDAVRPLTSPAHIDAVFAAARVNGAAMLGIPVADTLKRVDDANRVTATLPRAGLWQAQTPQAFRRDWLAAAYARRATLGDAITDDAQLMEAAGHAVEMTAGSNTNFKITTRDDFALALTVVQAREGVTADRPAARPYADEAQW